MKDKIYIYTYMYIMRVCTGVYICIYMCYIHIYVCTCVYVCIYIRYSVCMVVICVYLYRISNHFVSLFLFLCVCVSKWMSMLKTKICRVMRWCICTCRYMEGLQQVCSCMYVCMYVYIFVCVYIYIAF